MFAWEQKRAFVVSVGVLAHAAFQAGIGKQQTFTRRSAAASSVNSAMPRCCFVQQRQGSSVFHLCFSVGFWTCRAFVSGLPLAAHLTENGVDKYWQSVCEQTATLEPPFGRETGPTHPVTFSASGTRHKIFWNILVHGRLRKLPNAAVDRVDDDDKFPGRGAGIRRTSRAIDEQTIRYLDCYKPCQDKCSILKCSSGPVCPIPR
ncbi:hypothetical protein LX36DRAFT_416832 [Colletotrichum falcatum]|nr:hypothetical protein LX36DRAFT_416832 [Colletotrichum falcatum]